MVLIVLLFISIVIQGIATGVAVRLIRATKYNASWILFIVALTIIGLQQVEEFISALNVRFSLGWDVAIPAYFRGWGGVVSSLCLAIGVLMVKKILTYIALRERERKLSDDRVLTAVIQAEELHKQRLAKELHDGLGPLLSTAHMSISAIEPQNENQRLIIENAEHAMAVAIKTLREVSNNLSPHILENFGVARAVSGLVKAVNNTRQVEAVLSHNISGVRFSQDIEMTIYRVVSELINNTIKHSGADKITISIDFRGDFLRVVYSDNGCGFDTSETHRGMGLSNIRSRVSSAKGEFSIESGLRRGVVVRILFSGIRLRAHGCVLLLLCCSIF